MIEDSGDREKWKMRREEEVKNVCMRERQRKKEGDDGAWSEHTERDAHEKAEECPEKNRLHRLHKLCTPCRVIRIRCIC